ncbi:hypothetical protein BWQ96_01637 [Gracilariopsis chorda]|uniref:Uncharacterized protein n=1 Tax=Gracilariopsis chorda TaxID=448386 RepID=A0A2V3J251_9FLOR|nr:hypothetical protein BWQ96_01637 [Gracilariopsis chorda]|eukprot:PXF48468.1 hypothetical protein BWQ96_01637 [Gracilariopsis chorda]
MNADTENLAPQAVHNALKSRTRKPLGGLSVREGKQVLRDSNRSHLSGKRRALGDITNRGGELNNFSTSHTVKRSSAILDSKLDSGVKSLPKASHSFKIPMDHFGEVLDPEILPDPLPEVPYTPVLFDDGELQEARERLREQTVEDDDDTLDFMGKPYVRTRMQFQREVELPFDPADTVYDLDQSDPLDFTSTDLFHPDQLIRKDEYSTLELA